MCSHSPACPGANESNCCQAHVTADHLEQGWCRLCNGVIVFDDGAYLSPTGEIKTIPTLVRG
jgi:hypothetical protein